MSIINTALFKGFTFDGVNSLDYDIYITGGGVYNAPERAVEKVSVPGRNGDLTIDQGRFENVPVTYAKCGCAAKTQAELAEKVAAFRNALCSRVGYKRLTDDYNKDEYRMAMYVSGLEVEAVAQHRMGSFDIVFDAMPQRFLKSGEIPRTIGGSVTNTKTESGSIVSIESDGGDAVTSLVAQIEPVQSGSGDPSPTNVRAITGWTAANVNVAGKNLLDTSGMSTAGQNQAIFTRDADGSIYVGGKAVNTVYRIIGSVVTKAGERYTLTGTPAGGGSGKYRMTVAGFGYDNGNGYTFTGDGETHNVSIDIFTGYPQSGTLEFKPMLRLASDTDDTYEPYTGNTVTVSFGSAGTVYGGTLDVVTGVLTVNTAIFDLGSFTWTRHATYTNCYSVLGNSLPIPAPINVCYDGLCEQYKVWYTGADVPISTITSASNNGYLFISPSRWSASYKSIVVNDNRGLSESAFKTAMNGVHLVCPLATPTTTQLTAHEVELLAGQNNVWADTGDITITWGADPYKVVNPTLFDAKPLIKVTGHGVLTIGSQSITINGTSSTQVIYIDCDTMEAWEMSGSAMIPRNDYVQNAGDDFPVLVPGANKITLGVGITRVVFTPRWWRV